MTVRLQKSAARRLPRVRWNDGGLAVAHFDGSGRWLIHSAPIARVIASGAFATALVVVCEASHELLSVRVPAQPNLGDEVVCLHATESGYELAPVEDLDISALTPAIAEPQIASGRCV